METQKEQQGGKSMDERDPFSTIEAADTERALEFLKQVNEDESRYPESPVRPETVKDNIDHSERVRVTARQIAEGEELDINLMELAALLHDVQKLDHRDKGSGGIDTWHHHSRGAALAEKFILTDLKKSAETARKIQAMINAHSDIPFIRRYWEANYKDKPPTPYTKEEFALRDADTIDQLTAHGMKKIVRFRQVPNSFFYKEDGGDIQKAIASARKSFEEARGVITTETGKKIADERVKVMQKFFDGLSAVKSLDEFEEAYKKFVEENS